MSILLLLVATGCSDPDESGGNAGLTAPVVVSVAPLSGASGACINTIVTATFSKAMNPATMDYSTTFTLTGPSGTGELGQIYVQHHHDIRDLCEASSCAQHALYRRHLHQGQGRIWHRAREPDGVELHHGRWSLLRGWRTGSGFGDSREWCVSQHHRHCRFQ